MRASTFADVAAGDGASVMNCVFQEYLIPITFSSEHLHLHMSYNDVDPALSPIWFDDAGNVLAAALLAVRKRRGWIGGFGVAPEYRGKGYAGALMDRLVAIARERQLETLTLEVLCGNTPAIRVYERAGFNVARRLFCFEILLEASEMPPGFSYVRPAEFIDEPDPAPPCWQREAAGLRNGAASRSVSDGSGTYALFRNNATLAQVLKLRAADPAKLTPLARAVAAGTDFQSVLVLNEPEESPLSAYAQAAGWEQPFVQYEMKLTL